MPIQIHLDTADDSQIDMLGNSAFSAVRGGVATDLPTDSTSMEPDAVLFQIMQAVFAIVPQGTPHPYAASSHFNRIQVLGLNSQAARFRMFYEPFEGVGTSLIIDIGSSLSSYATSLVPGTREPIKVEYTGGGSGEDIPADYPAISMLRAIRRVSVTQLKSGTLDVAEAATFGDYVERVNDATWQGKPAGSWIISEATASISKYAGYYSRRLSAISQGVDRWSYFAIARSNLTGKYAGDADAIATATSAALAHPYTAQKVWAENGVTRVDPYLLTNFATLFGF